MDDTEKISDRIERKLDRVHERIDDLVVKVAENHGSLRERIARVETKASIMGGISGTIFGGVVAWLGHTFRGD